MASFDTLLLSYQTVRGLVPEGSNLLFYRYISVPTVYGFIMNCLIVNTVSEKAVPIGGFRVHKLQK